MFQGNSGVKYSDVVERIFLPPCNCGSRVKEHDLNILLLGTLNSKYCAVQCGMFLQIKVLTVVANKLSPSLISRHLSVPGRPTMMISTTMDNTALIQWQPPKDMVGELMGYQLQYKRVDEDEYASLELRKTNDHYTATGLHKGATYIFRLSARNRAGVGEAYVKEISTPEDVPSGFPINLRVTGLTQSSTQLAWDPPLLAERNGKITSYVVVYRDINIQQNNTNRTSDTQMTIQGLSPDTTYDIRVQAFTSKGGGPLSPSIQSRTMSNGRVQ